MNAVLNIVKNDGTPPPNPGLVPPISCTVEVVTPMFLAGAEQRRIGVEGMRSASVKAALRWWWRATVDVADARALAEHEALLFGSTEVGQGLRVRTKTTTWSIIEKPPAQGAMSYLLGQGLYNHKEGVVRPAVIPGSKEVIEVLVRADSPALTKI